MLELPTAGGDRGLSDEGEPARNCGRAPLPLPSAQVTLIGSPRRPLVFVLGEGSPPSGGEMAHMTSKQIRAIEPPDSILGCRLLTPALVGTTGEHGQKIPAG